MRSALDANEWGRSKPDDSRGIRAAVVTRKIKLAVETRRQSAKTQKPIYFPVCESYSKYFETLNYFENDGDKQMEFIKRIMQGRILTFSRSSRTISCSRTSDR
jgi:hypothetical protein